MKEREREGEKCEGKVQLLKKRKNRINLLLHFSLFILLPLCVSGPSFETLSKQGNRYITMNMLYCTSQTRC